MRIALSDYFLARLNHVCRDSMMYLGNLETSLLEPQLNRIKVVRPVYICGLARSGSTILLELLARANGVATHRYRDFPFLTVPWVWNRFLNSFNVDAIATERPHGDRIQITADSPESMEEPIWMLYFSHLHSVNASQRLTKDIDDNGFPEFYDAHLRKILLIRQGTRYVAKNNYSIGRIEYLSKLYPDAQFIVPIRHPMAHVHSLVSQHERFCNFARTESRVSAYLQASGHFEFGPQRIPIQFDESTADRTLDCWNRGEEYRGYAVQWNQVYGFVRNLIERDKGLANRIHVVRYEDFCAAPETVFTAMLKWTELADTNCIPLDHICAAELKKGISASVCDSVWDEVEKVAVQFGYAKPSGS